MLTTNFIQLYNNNAIVTFYNKNLFITNTVYNTTTDDGLNSAHDTSTQAELSTWGYQDILAWLKDICVEGLIDEPFDVDKTLETFAGYFAGGDRYSAGELSRHIGSEDYYADIIFIIFKNVKHCNIFARYQFRIHGSFMYGNGHLYQVYYVGKSQDEALSALFEICRRY